MLYEIADFFGADDYFSTEGAEEWSEIQSVLDGLTLQLQPSGQAGLDGKAIFDPKGTNKALTEGAAAFGWGKISLPPDLTAFGTDWDAGKNAVLAEWQFSNYPFLWNNIVRSQVVARNGWLLAGMMDSPKALLVVTKSGCLPASQSTLYFEQGKAQLEKARATLDLDLAIRLVGLTIEPNATTVSASWNNYAGRTSRSVVAGEYREFDVAWKPAKAGRRSANLTAQL
ncbi:hypothetical protein Q5762_16195 [Streptomyces sp. P9(2023)]|uniref:hypothetical protein n=1 Tax=Streptomyces sp. P9(2023) TaxID=3064394 RepID=UPI0028F4446D|nr:hypothetical protein [Streptomyces sp. P9(2023)]MDT9689852.1 hypothetical protein [Streptomyces sp. P9(2023)]